VTYLLLVMLPHGIDHLGPAFRFLSSTCRGCGPGSCGAVSGESLGKRGVEKTRAGIQGLGKAS
jgi:hypothetical protein